MNNFLKHFKDELVEIITTMETVEEINDELVGKPVVFQGIVVDADDKFVYLGALEGTVESSLKLDDIRYCNKIEAESFEEIFGADPERDTELN